MTAVVDKYTLDGRIYKHGISYHMDVGMLVVCLFLTVTSLLSVCFLSVYYHIIVAPYRTSINTPSQSIAHHRPPHLRLNRVPMIRYL